MKISTTHLNRQIGSVLNAVSTGEEVILTRYGRPVARIVSASESSSSGAHVFPPGIRNDSHGHDWVQVTVAGDSMLRYLCSICGETYP